MITEKDLLEEAARFLHKNYGMRLHIPIIINPTLLFEEGGFEHTVGGRAVAIHIAEFMLYFAEDDVIYEVLHHELVHYAMYMNGKSFIDGQPEFEAELRRVGAISTGTHVVGMYHMYQCECCDREIESPLYIADTSGYLTECCDSPFKRTGKHHVYNGKERVY